MSRIYGYSIQEADSAEDLTLTVVNVMQMAGSWQPIGGVAVSGGRFYQAMVMTEPYRDEMILENRGSERS